MVNWSSKFPVHVMYEMEEILKYIQRHVITEETEFIWPKVIELLSGITATKIPISLFNCWLNNLSIYRLRWLNFNILGQRKYISEILKHTYTSPLFLKLYLWYNLLYFGSYSSSGILGTLSPQGLCICWYSTYNALPPQNLL